MEVIALNAKLLRDPGGETTCTTTRTRSLWADGESLDVIWMHRHTKYPSGSVFFLYTPNLDHLSNDAEKFSAGS